MKKKIVFGLAMLIALTTSLSAQMPTVRRFSFVGILSEQEFIMARNELILNIPGAVHILTDKLPNAVSQTINNCLRNYPLDIGDVFSGLINYQGVNYTIGLRIIDARNSKWQFYALYI
ncbi:MAG: hypothetical protein LBI03_04690 [Clostridiales bacterium]|jgi:hypothetical protein|nr:hypothetical protein [Clostridiales bacterium]